MIRTGGGVLSITRICTVLVWLRSKQRRVRRRADAGRQWSRRRPGKILERIAGRMRPRDVERLEVVPLVLDLRALDGREAEPAHDVLHLLDRLRDRVQMAEAQRRAGQRRVERRRRLRLSRPTPAAPGPLRTPPRRPA